MIKVTTLRRLAEKAEIDIRHIEKHADGDFEEHLMEFAKLIEAMCSENRGHINDL